MNKVTQAVIDLSGEWPANRDADRLVRTPEKPIGYSAWWEGWVKDSRKKWEEICTRKEFDKERGHLVHDWSSDNSGLDFKSWLKTKSEQNWPTDNLVDAIGQNGGDGLHHKVLGVNKYHRQLKGVTVDVYDVLKAFEVTCPALQHLIKKALCCGLRGHKDQAQDLQDIIDSAMRAKELSDE